MLSWTVIVTAITMPSGPPKLFPDVPRQYTNCFFVSISHMTGQGAETGKFVASTLYEIWACILSITAGVTFYT